jgi:hypothetical protein
MTHHYHEDEAREVPGTGYARKTITAGEMDTPGPMTFEPSRVYADTSVNLAQRPTAHLAQPMSSDEMQAWWRTAEAFVQSGVFKGVEQVAQAYVKILLGRDLGLNPAQAMMSLDLVRGNLQMRGTLLARMVKESPSHDYERVESDAEHCVTDFYGISKRTGEWTLLGREEFTMEDAKAAKLVKPDGAWLTWPKNMLFWRTISNGVKMHCPDLLGGVPVYTEADDFRELPAIGAVEGEPVEPGWQGVSVADAAEIEKVIRRAERLGHAGLSNRGAVQMTLNGQPKGLVREWIKQSHAALDAMVGEITDRVHEAEGLTFDSPQSEEEGRVDVPEHIAENVTHPGGTLADADAMLAPDVPDVHPEQTALAVPVELDQEIALAKQAVASATSEREEKERRKTLEALEASKARLGH